ncbi:hypothetical protein KSP40_PGU013450 [Platanthera guangdongensis]|uniref:Uncharacterized protein n=1 Tax=Platanthera guangdongensis TaxID=2320717 RepID=A0ABR2LPH8_9ASPA
MQGARSMSSVPTRNSPDKPDLRPSFRKPSNDSAHRKYRHHSPADVSDSSSSGGSPRREQRIIQLNSLENRNKVSDDRARKHHGKESERDPGRCHSSRGSDSHRYPDNYRSSRDYQNNDEGGGYHRHSDEEDRNSVRYSVRELRSIRSDREHDNSFERSKENRNVDRCHTTDKFENSGHRNRGKDIEVNASADLRYNEKESARAGSRKISSMRDNKRADEWEQPRERNDRDERRIYYRSPSDYPKESAHTPEDSRGHAKDSVMGRGSDSYRLKESRRTEIDEHDYHARKRRYTDRDTRKCEDKYSRDPDENRKKGSASFPVLQVREERSESHVDKNSNAA